MRRLRIAACATAVALVGGVLVPAQDKATPQQVRVIGPTTLLAGTRNLVYAEGLFGKDWRLIEPKRLTVTVGGDGQMVEDPAGIQTNPFEVRGGDAGKVTVAVQAAGQMASRTFPVGEVKPAGLFEAEVNPATMLHRFHGMGGGVLFYDNQFDITPGDDLYDWCFKDVRTSFLHVLIRPGCEPENDNGDWRKLDLTKFDFKPLDRPFRILRKALDRNPDLKIYASLYSPPAWMKTNGDTKGEGSLKPGLAYRQEMAEYVFAYLKHAHAEKIPVHYVGLFNEPDFPHTQEGMHVPDLGVLAEIFRDCTKALDTLIAADPELKKAPPVYVFPDTLGPGSITRAGNETKKLRDRVKLLDRVGVWGVHDYFDQAGDYRAERFRELRAFPGVKGKPVWMTEWGQTEPHGDLASGVAYGAKILNALRSGAEAWMVYEWCHPSGNQAGLVSTDWGAKKPRERYWRSKAYHVFRQIANTSPTGAKVVAMTGRWKGTSQARGQGAEYLALKDGADVVLHVMNTEPVPIAYRVQVKGPAASAEGWLTTPLADMEPTAVKTTRQSGITTLGGVMPANSLLSVVLKGKATN